MKKLKLCLLLLILFIVPTNAFAINEVNVYFFYSDSCNICEQEKAYLDALKLRYPNMRVYSYEIDNSTSNRELMARAKQLYNKTSNGVPFTVIGDKAFLGYSQNSKALFQKTVYDYSKTKYNNQLGKILGIGYRTDLDGKVEEYKNNDSYVIEESSGNILPPVKDENSYDKYQVTFYLVGTGIILALIAGIIYMVERKR